MIRSTKSNKTTIFGSANTNRYIPNVSPHNIKIHRMTLVNKVHGLSFRKNKTTTMHNSIRLTALCLGLFAANAQAQESISSPIVIKKDSSSSEKAKTLFGTSTKSPIKSFGLSVSPIVQFGQMGTQAGLAAALHLNNKWEIGASFLRSARDENSTKAPHAFHAFTVAYTPKANSLIHVSFPLAIGAISTQPARILDQNLNTDPMPQGGPGSMRIRDNFGGRDRDGFQMGFRGPKALGIQPGVQVELNVLKNVRLFTAANYRFALGENSTSEMQGFSGQVGLKLGIFDRKFGANKKK